MFQHYFTHRKLFSLFKTLHVYWVAYKDLSKKHIIYEVSYNFLENFNLLKDTWWYCILTSTFHNFYFTKLNIIFIKKNAGWKILNSCNFNSQKKLNIIFIYHTIVIIPLINNRTKNIIIFFTLAIIHLKKKIMCNTNIVNINVCFDFIKFICTLYF